MGSFKSNEKTHKKEDGSYYESVKFWREIGIICIRSKFDQILIKFIIKLKTQKTACNYFVQVVVKEFQSDNNALKSGFW